MSTQTEEAPQTEAQRKAQTRAEEITFLLGCGEGEHAIAKALGVKPDSLRRQLHRDGNAHLIPQVFAYAEERRQQGNR